MEDNIEAQRHFSFYRKQYNINTESMLNLIGLEVYFNFMLQNSKTS